MEKRLPSLRKRYFTLALLLAVLAGGWSILSYQKVQDTQTQIGIELDNIRQQRNKLATIEKSYFHLYQSIDLFLLNPLDGADNVRRNIASLFFRLQKQKSATSPDDSELLDRVDGLITVVTSLGNEINSLMDARMDVSQQYPGLAVAAFDMNNPQQTVNNGFRLLIEEIENGGFDPESDELYPSLLKAQTDWAKAISQLRIYTTNRLATFSNSALEQQAQSLYDIYEQLLIKLDKLEMLYEQEDSFIGSDTLNEMLVNAKRWHEIFNQVRELLEKDGWRRDTHIVQTIIMPLSDKVSEEFQSLEQLLSERESSLSITHASNSQLLTRLLTGIIILFLAFISGLIASIDWLIFRPLQHLSEALKSEELGEQLKKMPTPRTYELGSLLSAFKDMDQQINRRQRKLEQNERELIEYRDHLEELVEDRTAEINSIVNTAADAILSIDTNGIVRTFNKAAENMFGYLSDEIIGKSVNQLIGKEHKSHHDAYINNYLTTGRTGIIGTGRELQARRKDGSVFPIYISVSEMSISGAKHFTGIIRDITEQKQAEMELKKSKELAESASQIKSQFVANVSHEIRTPMNAIIGFSELVLHDSQLSETSRKNVEKIETSSKALLTIINDILDLSKLESGKLSFESVCIHLANFITESLHLFTKQLEEKSLTLKTHIDPAIPERVMGDPTRLRQVLTNLLSNAIKFTKHGTVSINVSSQNENEILFEITDTGIGMSAEQKEAIFEAFSQADSSTTRKFGGTGLGTSISKQLIEQMGGKIWLESEVGKGSSFFFTIPFGVAKDKESDCLYAAVASERHETPELTADHAQRENKEILLIEDNVFNQQLISQQLLACGYEADIAANGEIGRKMWLAGDYAMVLSDISMPVMDGYQLIDFIRQHEADQETHAKVVAMTANAMAGEKERCLEKGFDDYISKPMSIDQLRQLVKRWTAQ